MKQKEKEFAEIKKQIGAIEEVFENSPFEFNKKKLQAEIVEKQDQLKHILNALKTPETVSESVKKNDVKSDIRKLRENLIRIKSQADYDVYLNQSRTSTENKLDALLEQKGKLNAEIEFLEKQIQLIISYEDYKNKMLSLKAQIDSLKDETERLANLQKN
ncbi:MAG: hypothetical protein LIO85_00365 [Rikenellaceae bacterium]|nr:hypothetical protein [Rikenellaceae bacterium]MCC8173162.1 hypothetical protein [Odoribacter sp.]